MKLRAFLITFAISAATIFPLHDALAEQASRVLTTHATYTANSTQAKAIQQWLRDHPGFQEGRRLGDPEQFGTLSVTYRLTLADDGRAYALGDPTYPPMPLPRTGNNGDTVSITTCTGGSVEQTWTYEWVGDSDSGDWVLVSYSFNSKSCSSGG